MYTGGRFTVVQQKLTQHCKAIILQLKTKQRCTHHFLRNIFMDVKDIVFALKEFTV